jgi:hypothetical protein
VKGIAEVLNPIWKRLREKANWQKIRDKKIWDAKRKGDSKVIEGGKA